MFSGSHVLWKSTVFKSNCPQPNIKDFFIFYVLFFYFSIKKMIPNFVIKFKDEFLKMKIMNGHNFFDEKWIYHNFIPWTKDPLNLSNYIPLIPYSSQLIPLN